MDQSEFENVGIETVQAIQLYMLKVLADICDTHTIRYYLAAGTLLGAVRHKDFIPWDDDLDLTVPRPDFNRLLEVLKTEGLPEGMTYSWLDNPSHDLPFLKIFYRDSYVEESKLEPQFRKSKIWVDVFPLDGVPTNPLKLKLVFFIAIQLRNFLYTGTVDPKKLVGFQKIGTMVLKPLSQAIGAPRIARWINSFARCFDFTTSQLIGNLVWGTHADEAIEKEPYLSVVDLEFVDAQFHCPSCYDRHLTKKFGDYMTLPPEDKRKSHLNGSYYLKKSVSNKW
jgi:lipopolysaccharide cholinephosphotransferase